MKKILVPTDFSARSKAGLRFAIQWAVQQKMELVFIHCLFQMRPTGWSDAYYDEYVQERCDATQIRLSRFVAAIYRGMNQKPGKHSFVVVPGIGADVTLLDYCRKNPSIDGICISTRGAGNLRKLFGTNTGNLITKSPVPVMAVPYSYRVAPVETVMYATDFRNYAAEIPSVVAFAKPLKATVEILHFTWPDEYFMDQKLMEASFKKQFRYPVKLHLEKTDATLTLVRNLQEQVKKSRPSVLVMFTNQKRSFFQRLFSPSYTEHFSFATKVPLLVFSKSRVNKSSSK